MTSTLGTLPSASPLRAMGVSTMVGGIVLAVMPCAASSRANALVSPMTPPLDAT